MLSDSDESRLAFHFTIVILPFPSFLFCSLTSLFLTNAHIHVRIYKSCIHIPSPTVPPLSPILLPLPPLSLSLPLSLPTLSLPPFSLSHSLPVSPSGFHPHQSNNLFSSVFAQTYYRFVDLYPIVTMQWDVKRDLLFVWIIIKHFTKKEYINPNENLVDLSQSALISLNVWIEKVN